MLKTFRSALRSLGSLHSAKASGGSALKPNFVKLGSLQAFEDIEKDASSKVVLYFTASWCPPCRAIGPVYESMSRSHPDILFTKVDIDEIPTAAEKFHIRSVPTFVFKHKGRIIDQFSGADQGNLEKQVLSLQDL